jgi:hypothetical protein
MSRRHPAQSPPPRRSLVLGIVAAAILALASPAPVPVAAAASANSSNPYRLDLARGGDFVPQANFVQCVGASMQMMLNIVGPRNDRTAATQRRLQSLARELSGPTRQGFERKGASVRGWSAGLNQLGAGPYRLIGATTLQEALRVAASAIRRTGKPVGLLVWAGRHAWVMSGFEATADPALASSFRVTKAIVMDPLYPYGSSRWGASPRPRQAISPATLGQQFVPRRRGTWAGAVTGTEGAATMSALAGKYVIVMPFVPVILARDRHVAA